MPTVLEVFFVKLGNLWKDISKNVFTKFSLVTTDIKVSIKIIIIIIIIINL
jgi:hypothetical protein